MKKQVLFFAVAVMFLAHLAMAQTYVAPGDGTLSQAIADAQSGDILELVPEGLYTEATNNNFGTLVDKDLIIRVEGEDPQKAILQLLTPASDENTPVFFHIGNNASLTLQDIEFDGSLNGIANAEYLIQFYMGEFPAPTLVKKIQIEGCNIHDLVGHVLSAGSSDMRANVVVDSSLINDCVMENIATTVYYKYCGANYIKISNCTIHTTTSYGLRIAGPQESNSPEHTPAVDIDHTTWYNIGTTDQREIIQLEKGPNLNPWTITNSIFVKHINKDRTSINLKDTTNDSLATVTNICLWDIGNINWRSHTVRDTITMDPQFADPDNGDFTLPAGSILLTFGSDGGPIGDLRWATNASAVERKSGALPGEFSLGQNYPNPFNPTTTISFSLGKAGQTVLSVYDIMGREIAVLVNGKLSPGQHRVSFDASELSSGIYFYRLESAGQILTRKMTLIQ